MGALMLSTGLFYAYLVSFIPREAPPVAQLGPLIPYVLAVIVGSITIQIALFLWSPREATAVADERERPAMSRAGHLSGMVLGGVVILGAGAYVVTGQGTVLFHTVVGGLIVAQLTEYVLQILYFRLG